MIRIWRYWRFLLEGRYKVWHLVLLGALWIAGGLTLGIVDHWGSAGTAVGGLAIANGVAHFILCARARTLQGVLEEQIDAADARSAAAREHRAHEDAIPRAPKQTREESRPLPAAPRIGDDPFRNPPRAHVVVVRHDREEAPVPRAATADAAKDPSSEPKLLV